MSSEEPLKLTALYSPSNRMVACVLIHAAYSIPGYQAVNQMFDPGDWLTHIVDDFKKITDTPENWRKIAAMPKEKRPGPEWFERQVASASANP